MRLRPFTAARRLALACSLACLAITYPMGTSAEDQAPSKSSDRAAAENAGSVVADAADKANDVGSNAPLRDKLPSPLPVPKLCELIASVAVEFELPAAFFANLLWQESRFDYHAVSPAGAQGVAQFMPAVAEAMNLEDPFDPTEAVPASATLLRQLLRQFGNLGLAAAAYNAGPKRVIDWKTKGSRLPKETRDYVEIITGKPVERWKRANGNSVAFDIAPRLPCTRNRTFAKLHARTSAAKTPLRGASARKGMRAAASGRKKSGRTVVQNHGTSAKQ
jgi:soluble lytic murein transglycosylase-like protein